MIQALVFDFDGLILETEEPEFQAWQEIYRQHGAELTLENWLPLVGAGSTTQTFDPYAYLAEQTGQELDFDAIRRQFRQRTMELVEGRTILPGVESLLAEAKLRRLRLAVASSSPRSWVAGHLQRLGLLGEFETLACGDEVEHTKPYPDLYLAAVAQLGVQPEQAVAFEDSLNGLIAARQAGLFCVVVPSVLTRGLSFVRADLCLESLAAMPLAQMLEQLTIRNDSN